MELSEIPPRRIDRLVKDDHLSDIFQHSRGLAACIKVKYDLAIDNSGHLHTVRRKDRQEGVLRAVVREHAPDAIPVDLAVSVGVGSQRCCNLPHLLPCPLA